MNVSYQELKGNQTQVVIEPCYPGYGVTVGNALRRVLLSSLPGSAVCAVKIQNIQHEYDTIDHVKEDIVEIIMNLKKLRVVSYADEPVTLQLHAKSEKIVTAGDIKKNAQVEIVNKDLAIATLTDKKAELEMAITVKKGIGYEPVEERVVEKKEIGVIQIDSIFSPILNVGFKVENVRVGQRTDYEKVILVLTTDGTMTAQDAVGNAVAILQEQFVAVTGAKASTEEGQLVQAEASAHAEEAEPPREEKGE